MSETEDTSASTASGGGYSGVVTAFPYAFRASGSRVFKLYTGIAGLIVLFGTLLFVFAITTVLGELSGTPAGILTFQPALFILVWLFTIAPLAAPVLLAARRHRLGRGEAGFDRAIALSGFVFLVALYLAAIVTTPAAQQPSIEPGLFAPLLRFFYGIPGIAAIVPLLIAAGLMVFVHRTR